MAGSEPAQKVRPQMATEAEERRLIEAAQRDPSCFAEVYEIYFELVYAYVVRRIRNRDETEDLTAEVFRKALANLPRFKWTGAPFVAWLFRIASNMIADRTKRAAREGKVAFSDPEASLTVGPVPRGQPGQSRTQQTELEDYELRAQLFRLVDELAEDQRRVVTMRFAEEKSIGEIADELGRSEGAVKQLQFRALENLRKRITTENTEAHRDLVIRQ
jgi:RNA polymerase sigma-70 factor (ECF subfamily)